MLQTYVTDITVNDKDIILRSLLRKRLLNSGNCMKLSENGDQDNKVKVKKVEVWSLIFSFSSDYASNLSYAFMNKMNFLYKNYVLQV